MRAPILEQEGSSVGGPLERVHRKLQGHLHARCALPGPDENCPATCAHGQLCVARAPPVGQDLLDLGKDLLDFTLRLGTDSLSRLLARARARARSLVRALSFSPSTNVYILIYVK